MKTIQGRKKKEWETKRKKRTRRKVKAIANMVDINQLYQKSLKM
jgi:hypothetical protein